MEYVGYMVADYDLNNVTLIRMKSNYKLYCNGNELVKLVSPKMGVPFGIEKFGYKEIINLEFTDQGSNNEMYNFVVTVKQLDAFMGRLSWDKSLHKDLKNKLPYDFLKDVAGKAYTSCFKKRPTNFDPHLRVHLKKKGNNCLTEVFDEDNKYVPLTDLKGRSFSFTLHVDTVWVSKDSYGLTWILEKGC